MARVNRKVQAASVAGGAAGVVSSFICWGLDAAFWNGDAAPPVPMPVVGMVGLVVGTALPFVAGYLRKSGPDDV